MLVAATTIEEDGGICQVSQSSDGGKSWQATAQVRRSTGVLWQHQGTLYMFATNWPSDLWLLRSDDAGKTNLLDVNGQLRLLSAVKPPLQATTNLAAVFDATDDGQEIELEFAQFHPMPGGQVKFCVIRDSNERFQKTICRELPELAV